MPDWGELHPRRFFLETWQKLDEEAADYRVERKAAGLGYDYKPLVAFATGAIFLTLMEYFGMPHTFRKIITWLADQEASGAISGSFFRDFMPSPTSDPHPWWEFSNHAYWAVWRVLGFFLLPLIVIRLSGERVRDQHLECKGFRDKLWIYVLSFLVVLVCVIGVSFEPGFQEYYPFYKQSHRSWLDFVSWELLYLAQFFSLEFFFRGWWLRACRSLGSGAVFAMTVPYVMIHYGKEFPETLGAIFAGIFLGTLAMRTKSIWGGFLVHSFVAVSMDLASMLQTTGLPEAFAP